MKFLSLILTLVCIQAQAADLNEITVLCTRTTDKTCEERSLNALQNVGCKPDAQSVKCNDASSDPMTDPSEADGVRGKDYCVLNSMCFEPNYSEFGKVSCPRDSNKLSLSKIDKLITMTVRVGMMNEYVRHLCLEEKL